MTITTPEEQTMLDAARDQRDRHGPAWRWDLAEDCLHHRLDPWRWQFDHDFLDVHHYRTLCDRSEVGKRQAVILYPAIAAAEELNADIAKTGHLKIAVLGKLDPKEVSQQFHIDEAVFRTWERTFFDVRGCHLATHWVYIHIIQPELAAGRGDLAARLRMVSAVGTLAAKVILQADTRLPIREAQKLFERQLKLHLKFDAAIEMTPDTNKNRLFFIQQHAKLQLEERHLKLAREKLVRKCEEALDRHKLAMICAEVSLEREPNRATATAGAGTGAAAGARCDEGIALAEMGEKQSAEWLAARRREKEMAEQAALAARVAASPLGRLRWRHRDEVGQKVGIPPAAEPAEDRQPMVVVGFIPLAELVPKSMRMPLAGVPV
jgi:hypothetical protein